MPESEVGWGPSQALREHGLRPRKALGQSFLRDRSFLKTIVGAAELTESDVVLEIGPGTGVLTDALAARAGKVVAVELDPALVGVLRERFAASPTVEVHHEDALQIDPCALLGGRYKLVANIPYYITGPLLRRFLEAACQPDLMVLMVQREVGRRLAARPGDLSLLGVSAQYYADVDVIARVPAGAFYPRPKVDSAIVRLRPHRMSNDSPVQRVFFEVARAGFGMRRKQLANSLSAGLGVERNRVLQLLQRAGIDPTRRAETLSLTEWERLAQDWSSEQQPEN